MTVTFQAESKLKRIGDSCFSDSSLTSISVPGRVEILCKRCFAATARLETCEFESGSKLIEIEEECFSNCHSLRSIRIPGSVEGLGRLCFHNCSKLKVIEFEFESRLTRISELCFYQCSLATVCIPRSVEILVDKCFYGTEIERLTFESNSKLRRVEDRAFDTLRVKSIGIPVAVADVVMKQLGIETMHLLAFDVDILMPDFE
jgi:hypothetical protein